MRKTLLSWCLGLLLAPSVLQAQSYEELALHHRFVRAYHEAFALPAAEGTALAVAFRIPNPMLVFVRSRHEAPGRTFSAQVALTVQVFRDGRIAAEKSWQEDHYAATFEETQRQDLDLEGGVVFELEPGTYGYRLTFNDGNTDRVRQSWLRRITLPDFSALSVGEAVMVRSLEARPAGVGADLVNLGGDVAFGQAATALIPVGVPARTAPEGVRLQYTLRRLPPEQVREVERRRAHRQAVLARQRSGQAAGSVPPLEEEDPLPDEGASVVATGEVEGGLFVPVPALAGSGLSPGRVQWPAAGTHPAGFLAPVDLGGVQLEDGTYVLDVVLTAAGQTTPVRTRFQTHWRGRPISLYHPAVAIRNLSFIEDRQTIKTLLRGSYADQEARLTQYWEQRDPTPGTAFNELMAEYYRRVDYAASTFRTGTVSTPDGLKTDQARIYVVQGPPDAIDRTLSDLGGVEEAWTYPDGRRFVFWAATSLDAFELQAEEAR